MSDEKNWKTYFFEKREEGYPYQLGDQVRVSYSSMTGFVCHCLPSDNVQHERQRWSLKKMELPSYKSLETEKHKPGMHKVQTPSVVIGMLIWYVNIRILMLVPGYVNIDTLILVC